MKSERTYTEIFAENLKRLMREHDISQNELGRRLGISATAVNNWVNCTNVPRANMMDRICSLFGVTQAEMTTDMESIPNLSIPVAHPLPILGTICCGDGILTNESFDGFFFIDNSIKADYCLRVEGDSMQDANIKHGDIAFIRKSYDFMEGRIYAVLMEDNHAVLKKLYRHDDGILLMPCNEKYKPTIEKDIYIVGECVGIYSPL